MWDFFYEQSASGTGLSLGARFSPVISPPLLHIPSFVKHRRYVILPTDSFVKLNTCYHYHCHHRPLMYLNNVFLNELLLAGSKQFLH